MNTLSLIPFVLLAVFASALFVRIGILLFDTLAAFDEERHPLRLTALSLFLLVVVAGVVVLGNLVWGLTVFILTHLS